MLLDNVFRHVTNTIKLWYKNRSKNKHFLLDNNLRKCVVRFEKT